MTCIACGGTTEHRRVFADLEQCGGCGFISYPSPPGFDPSALYGPAYFAGDEYPDYVGQEPALRRSMRRHLSQMSKYTALRGALLEVGCAYGFFLEEAKRYFTVVGIDVTEDGVAHAKARGLDARCGDLLELDLTDRFDVICMWDTLEHLPRPDAHAERARALLAPGGTLFITTGDVGSLNARLRGARWRQIHPPTHLHYFSRDTIRKMLERTGFALLGIETAAYYHTLFNVLGSLALRRGILGRVAERMGALIGRDLGSQIGCWLDLRDIMFVAARAV